MLSAKLEQLLATVARNRPNDDLEIIRRAYLFSLDTHWRAAARFGEPILSIP